MQRVARGYLLFISFFDGVLGLVCAALIMAAPDGRFLGMGVLLPTIAEFPLADVFFRDFAWIGRAMLLVLGVPNLVAAVMLVRRSAGQYIVTLVAGVLLLLWCGFELIYLFNAGAVGFFVAGVAAICASMLLLAESPRTSGAADA